MPGSTTCSFSTSSPLLSDSSFKTHLPPLGCDAGFTLCGTSFCISATQQCVSGIPAARRRSLAGQAALGEALCPAGLQACYTTDMASLAMGKSVGWECVDTSKDMESCGGCQYPIMGEAKGEDCTAKAGVDNVSVSESGRRGSGAVTYLFLFS